MEQLPSALYKTELCKTYQEQGSCRYGFKCRFAHGHTDLRPIQRHKKYKTELCHNYSTTGFCPYESRCRFIHELHEQDEEMTNPFVVHPDVQTSRRGGRLHRRVRSASITLHTEREPRDTGSGAHSPLPSNSWHHPSTSDYLPDLDIGDTTFLSPELETQMSNAPEEEQLELSETIDHVVKLALESPTDTPLAESRHLAQHEVFGFPGWSRTLNNIILSPRRGESRMRVDLSPRRGESRMRVDLSPRRGEGRLHGPKSKSAALYSSDSWGAPAASRRQSLSMNSTKSKKKAIYATLPPRFFQESFESMERDMDNRRSTFEYSSSTDNSPVSSAASSGAAENRSSVFKIGDPTVDIGVDFSLKKSLFDKPAPRTHGRSATLPFIDHEELAGAPTSVWHLWQPEH